MSNNPRQDEKDWATDDEYKQEAYDTQDIQLPRTGHWLRVTEIPPMKLAKIAESYGMESVDDAIDQYGEDVTFEEVKERQDELPDDIIEGVEDVVEFFREVVAPAVLRPQNAHWDEPPTDPNARETFDLSNLHEEDLGALMDGITGDEATEGDPVVDEEGNYQGRFQGQPDRNRNRTDG